MNAEHLPFTDLIGRSRQQFTVPVFQRFYTWTPEQDCAQFWRDVHRAGTDHSTPQHFLGTLVRIPARQSRDTFRRWTIVDGQQRLTTLLLLLIALRNRIRQEDAATAGEVAADQIDHDYLTNFGRSGPDRYRLLLRGRDQDAICQLIDGPEVPSGISPAIESAYEHLFERVSCTDPKIAMRGIHKLSIVKIELAPNVDDPQAIFESLNATGQELSKSDLIRNCVLMRLEEDEQTAMYDRYWKKLEQRFQTDDRRVFDNFARDYLDMKQRSETQTKNDLIYPGFRRFWEKQRKTVELEPALSDLERHARHYAAFRIGDERKPARETRYARIRRLRAAPAITIMRLLECREQDRTLNEDDLLSALDLIESFLVRRLVCGLSTRPYDKVFAHLTSRILTGEPSMDLRVGFRLRPMGVEFPTDDQFRKALREDDMYGRPVCAVLLDRLENYRRKEPVDTSSLTIEHVLPQSANLGREWITMLGGDDWRSVQESRKHRLGNLTLTGYNSEYSNRPFEAKKTMAGGFRESPLQLNKFIREQTKWTEVEIDARGVELSDMAVEIWPDLEVPQYRVDAVLLRERQKRASGRTPESVAMPEPVRELFRRLRTRVQALGSEVVEIVEAKTVSYHRLRYFVEVVPRKRSLEVLLALPFDEADDPSEKKKDLRDWKIVQLSRYKESSQTSIDIPLDNDAALEATVHLIEQAYRRAE